MKISTLPFRIGALILSCSMILPSPLFALRNETTEGAGLEELAKILQKAPSPSPSSMDRPVSPPTAGLGEFRIRSATEVGLAGAFWNKPGDPLPAPADQPVGDDFRPFGPDILNRAVHRLPPFFKTSLLANDPPGLVYQHFSVPIMESGRYRSYFGCMAFDLMEILSRGDRKRYYITDIALFDFPRRMRHGEEEIKRLIFLPSVSMAPLRRAEPYLSKGLQRNAQQFEETREKEIEERMARLPLETFGEFAALHEIGGFIWNALLTPELQETWRRLYPMSNNPEQAEGIFLRNAIYAKMQKILHGAVDERESFAEESFSDKLAVHLFEQTGESSLGELGWATRPEEREFFAEVWAYFREKVNRGLRVHEVEPPPAESSTAPAAGLEEVHVFKSGKEFLTVHGDRLRKQGLFQIAQDLVGRSNHVTTVVGSASPEIPTAVVAYTHPEWEGTIDAQLKQGSIPSVTFVVSSYPANGRLLRSPAVIIRQAGVALPAEPNPAVPVIALRTLADVGSLAPGFVYAVAVNKTLAGQIVGPAVGILTFTDEQSRTIHALFA